MAPPDHSRSGLVGDRISSGSLSLIYITGVSASGKSAIAAELTRRGYEAHGVDEEGHADWIDRQSGRAVLFPMDGESNVDSHEWYQQHRWVLSQDRITQLKAQSDSEQHVVYLAGVAEGDDKVWHLFDKVIVLSLDEATMRQRVEQRQGNQFGRTLAEMAGILKWLGGLEETYRGFGAAIIDASKPLKEVVDEVLTVAGG